MCVTHALPEEYCTSSTRTSLFRPFVLAFVCLALFFGFSSPASARVISGSDMMDQNMEENLCALTFDDGPCPFTLELLDKLREYGIHATFFMLGRMVDYYPNIARQVAEEGHEIASHTYSHKNLRALSLAGQKSELERGVHSLQAIGIVPTFVRPPYGSYNEQTVALAGSLGLDVVLWSMDSKDWKRLPDDYTRLASVRGTAYEPGQMRGVFLFHDIHKRTIDDLPRIVTQLRQAGCERFVTFSEYIQGLSDPEPPLLMTRRPHPAREGEAVNQATHAGMLDDVLITHGSDFHPVSLESLSLPPVELPK